MLDRLALRSGGVLEQAPAPELSWRRWQYGATLVLLTGVYFVAGRLGLRLAFVNASATAVWPPTGIALAAFLLLGYRIWPAMLVGAFLVNLATAGTVWTSLGVGLGNMLEGLLGAYLVNRYARGRRSFERAKDIFKVALLAAVLSTTVSATIGVTTLSVAGYARWADYGWIWLTWWVGDAVADLVLAPLLVLWATSAPLAWDRARVFEAAGLLVSLCLVALVVFAGLFPSHVKNYPLEFVCIPLFVWAAFRFGQREAASAILLVAAIAIWGTLRGFGPFARPSHNESLLLLQAFMGITGLTTLPLAAVVAERKRVLEQLRQLAVSDPLTGLGNYRCLMHALDVEIRRSQRHGRPFAIVFLDMDGLKKINDRHGHLAGSHALCRVAEVLHASCRAIDTAARFGGDEFALVLPETDEPAAQRVAQRIAERIADDREKPKLSVSVGTAFYPRHGDSAEALLGRADDALYQAKARARTR